MQTTAIKTHKVTPQDTDILHILDTYLPALTENTIVAVTSKIVSICEGRYVKIDASDPKQKDALIAKESQFYLPREENKYHVSLTITNNILAPGAGIDESNANGYYILWPKDAQKTANTIREHLAEKNHITNLGVIITDSKTFPMRWGVTAISLAFSGFLPLKNYMNTPDIFGRLFVFEQMSIIDNLACGATLTMGEGAEQTPLAIIQDVPMVTFTGRNPTQEEVDALKIDMDTDVYGDFLKSAPWRKGEGK